MAPKKLPTNHIYHVDGCPPSVRAKITQLIYAAMDLAFIGSMDPYYYEEIEENFMIARHDLERTIVTKLKE